MKSVPRPSLVERRMSKFLREPPKVRTAASVIVMATMIVVVAGGVLLRALDHTEYASIWAGMWLALQTVTTVGFGDVVPHKFIGRVVTAVIMLEGVAFLAIVTAAITSTFVARAEQNVAGADGKPRQPMHERLDEFEAQLDRLEAAIERLAAPR